MLLPCEVAVKGVLPVIRALIAEELGNTYHLKQKEIAKILGVSQPAISLYYKKMRGKAIDLRKEDEVRRLIKKLSVSLVEEELSPKDCISDFCEVCIKIRAKGLICELHGTLDPSLDIEKCGYCMSKTTKC
ncbi:MAG: transcriptional regulator [Candidatus Bathyarchaeales archaeon]